MWSEQDSQLRLVVPVHGEEVAATLRIGPAGELRELHIERWSVNRADLVSHSSAGYDIVYSIGVLHHLDDPRAGFDAVLRNTRPGGRFHCWVYAREGNGVVIALVDPLRRVASRLPWWLTKYGLATPLALPYYAYAKLLRRLPRWRWLRLLPLHDYSLWIAEREFAFFRATVDDATFMR